METRDEGDVTKQKGVLAKDQSSSVGVKGL